MKKYVLALITLFSFLTLYSQQESIKRLNLKSPEVSAFEKYGEIPVSAYTGIPNISIPIYKVRSGDIELPISLDYHATAIKVDQEATWVGLNWLLKAGGVLSTQVLKSTGNTMLTDIQKLLNGMDLPITRNSDSQLSYYQYYKFGGSHEMEQAGYYGWNLFPNEDRDSEVKRTAFLEFVNGAEAKTYTANFMEYNFQFIYHPIQQKYIITGKDQKFKINGSSSSITTLVDPNGVVYYFEASESYNPTGSGDGAYSGIPVSYYLTKIISPSGRTITLRYKNYGYIIPLIKATDIAYSKYPGYAEGYVERKLSPEYTTVNQYLYEIESDDALVRFNVGSRVDMRGTPKKLDNIEVYDKLSGNKLTKRFVFSYDYYSGVSTGGEYISDYYKYMASYFNRPYDPSEVKFSNDQINKRLRLISLQEYGVDDNNNFTASAPYKFIYNSNTLPGKTSAAKDYWGNFNGTENSGGKYYHTLLPDVSYLGEDKAVGFPNAFSQGTTWKADNRFNSSTVGRGLISQIIYPTGGSNSFTFEPHKISNFPYSSATNTETWAVTKSLSTRKTNFDTSLPIDLLTAKEFILTQATTVNVRVDFYNPSSYDWADMRSKPMYLMKYTTIKNNIYGNVTESCVPLKTFVLTDLTGLSSSVTTKSLTETITLEPGKYRIQAGFSSFPQISSYDMSNKGRRDVIMTISHSSTDLLSEYKFSTVYKYTRKTDTDFMLPEKELTIKEFIVNEETGIECNISIETKGKYSWDRMQGSTAHLYKYESTRNADGTITEQLKPIKQWGVYDLSITSDTTIRKKTELVILEAGKYQMKTVLSVPGYPYNTPEYINSSGGKILMDIKKYTNTISGEMNADAVGIRIAEVTVNNEGKSHTVKYKYLDTGNPTGLMMNSLKFSRKKIMLRAGQCQIFTSGNTISLNVTSPDFVAYWILSSNNLKPSIDNEIGYSYVEIINSETGTEGLKFWNKRNYGYEYCKPFSDPRNGNLIEQSTFSKTGILLKKTTNKYSILNIESYLVNAVIEDIYVGNDDCFYSGMNHLAFKCPWGRAMMYKYPSVKYWIEKTQTTEENYFVQGAVTHEINFTYNPSNLLLSKKEEKTDNSETATEYLIYPIDYSTTAYPAALTSNNIINYPLEVVNTIKKSNGEFVLSGLINQLDSKGKIISASNLEFAGDLPISSFKFSNKTVNGNAAGNLGPYSPYTRYTARTGATYTTKGDIQNIIKDNNENTVYLWGYNNQYPVAEIVNSTYSKVCEALGGQTIIDDIANSLILSDLNLIKLKSLQSLLNEAQVTIYTYKPLKGILTVTNPAGITTYYDYDSLGRLKEIYLIDNNIKKTLQQYNYHYKNQ